MSVLTYLEGRANAAVLDVYEKGRINTSIETLKTRLGYKFPGELSSHFLFGSYTRDTILPRRLDYKSDIDYMIVFNQGGYRPQTYLDKLRRFVETYYSRSEISQSNPTIVLELNHIKFELVPALWNAFYGYQIPNGPENWQNTDPSGFGAQLNAKHAAEGYLFKQAIRLLKLWNAQNGYPYKSYWLETWAVSQSFFLCYNVKNYLFDMIDKLAIPYDTQWRREKVERAKAVVAEVRSDEANGWNYVAESTVKKLIAE